MLEKTMRMSDLYDFYESLLTSKQRNYMTLYYLDDYSLGEIAEQFGVSRQAVYDTLRRSESMLEDFEDKLALYSKFQKRSVLLKRLRKSISRNEEALSIVDSIENLE